MENYAAIDVSLDWSGICMWTRAQIVREAKVRSERAALVSFFTASGLRFARIGLEAWRQDRCRSGCMPVWSRPGGRRSASTRHVKAALKATTVKTDKNEARGMARLMRIGRFRLVHVKAPMVQETEPC